MGISRLDSLRLGSSKEDKFWGGENTLLSGERSGISRRQQSIKGGGRRVYRKVTANEGGSVKNVSEPYGEIR